MSYFLLDVTQYTMQIDLTELIDSSVEQCADIGLA